MLDANQYVIDLEQALGLPVQTIDGVFFWKLIRFTLSRQIEIARGTLEASKRQPERPSRLREAMYYLRSLDHCFRKPKALLYEHPRKEQRLNTTVDPYSWRVRECFENAGVDYCLLESDSHRRAELSDPRRWFLYPGHLHRIRYERVTHIPEETRRLLNTLETRILDDMGVKIDIVALVTSSVDKFKQEVAYFSRALRKVSPKVLFLVCGYGKESVVHAAKEQGIYTVELQHGTMYPFHLGYAYPGWERIPYFADSLGVYASAWVENISLSGVDIRVIGYEAPGDGTATREAREKTIDILFISQWIHSDRIFEFAEKTAILLPQLNVVCKVHPSDKGDERRQERYPHVRIVKAGGLGEYLAAADCAVTVFSTGIFEALRYGCRPMLLNMYGIQYMEDFVRVTGAPVLTEPEEMAALLGDDGADRIEYRDLQYKSWFADFNESAVLDYLGRPASD